MSDLDFKESLRVLREQEKMLQKVGTPDDGILYLARSLIESWVKTGMLNSIIAGAVRRQYEGGR